MPWANWHSRSAAQSRCSSSSWCSSRRSLRTSQRSCGTQYLVESEVQLTVSFNGKARFQKKFAADATNDEIQAAVLADEQSKKYLDGKQVVKVIVVPKKIVNVVIK